MCLTSDLRCVCELKRLRRSSDLGGDLRRAFCGGFVRAVRAVRIVRFGRRFELDFEVGYVLCVFVGQCRVQRLG